MKETKAGLGKVGRSFHAAAAGLGQTLLTEQNMRIHLVALIIVGAAGWWLQLEKTEWLLIILCCCAVMTAELLNTAIEYLCDIVRDKLHLGYKATKIPRDMAAAGVLITAMGAAAIGIAIFLPKILEII
jgi:diacylglycerol kinase